MKIFKKYLEYIGIIRNLESYNKKMKYKSIKDINLAERYLQYMKEISQFQLDRQKTIEQKNSQIVGQATIIISISSIFIPLLTEKLLDQSLFIILLLIGCYIFILFHYILSICHAIKTLEINKYFYITRSTNTVVSSKRAENELDFINEEISDLVIASENNDIQNNKKGENLILATRNFKIASISFSIFTLLIILFCFFVKPKTQKIEIINFNEKYIYENHN